MSYRIKKRKTKLGKEYFRIAWEKYVGNKRTQTHIPQSDWKARGFSEEMSFEEASQWAKSLNDKEQILRLEEKRNKIAAQLKEKGKVESAFLPPLLVRKFESEVIFRDLGRGDEKLLKYNSTPSHWRFAQKLITQIRIDPSDWFDSKRVIYTAFEKNKMSPSYVEKVLRLMNAWGYFYCKQLSKAWEKIPRPRDVDLERIRDKYVEIGKASIESAPLTQDILKTSKQKLTKPAHYDWLFVACWFGLRPVEVDSLSKAMTTFANVKKNGLGTWSISNDGEQEILWVYQSKLTGLKREKRWKGIPAVEKEQKEALEIIKNIAHRMKSDSNYIWKRPLTKTIKSATNENIGSYGPRKAFFDLMRDKGWGDIDVSAWLGHKDVKRSNTSYADPFKVRARKSKEAA